MKNVERTKLFQFIYGALLSVIVLAGCGSPSKSSITATQDNAALMQNPRPAPVYPPEAIEHHWHGTVILKVKVGSDLHPTSVEVMQSSGHEVLDHAAMDAVNKWTFEPDQPKSLKVELRF